MHPIRVHNRSICRRHCWVPRRTCTAARPSRPFCRSCTPRAPPSQQLWAAACHTRTRKRKCTRKRRRKCTRTAVVQAQTWWAHRAKDSRRPMQRGRLRRRLMILTSPFRKIGCFADQIKSNQIKHRVYPTPPTCILGPACACLCGWLLAAKYSGRQHKAPPRMCSSSIYF